ncbi:MAG: hypothetical protein H7Z41_07010 [Cytophagales bacterium]|nr:hypothetical protein [Armatimonadota bacterium]
MRSRRKDSPWLGMAAGTGIGLALIAGSVILVTNRDSERLVIVQVAAPPRPLKPGSRDTLFVMLLLRPGYSLSAPRGHLTSCPDTKVPVTVVFDSLPKAIRPEAPRFPRSPRKPRTVLPNQVIVEVPFTVAAAALPGTYRIAGEIRYRPCRRRPCPPPETAALLVEITVG